MAKTINNTITYGVSGKFGDQIVFRQVNGKTLMCKSPIGRGKTSAKQEEQREKFKKASQYAKLALANPVSNAEYTQEAKKKRGLSAYNVAVADYLTPPRIEQVDITTYAGNVGDKIKVYAFDDFKVKSVRVHIQAEDTSLVEEGTATQKGLEWIYTTKVQNIKLSGSKVIVTATDYAGNSTEKKIPIM